jgi:glycosyltransferase involved in cell wall biosynthesis
MTPLPEFGALARADLAADEKHQPRTKDGNGCRVTVVIAAYTEERWNILVRAVESVGRQTVPPVQLIVCIDNNQGLLERCISEWKLPLPPSRILVEVIADDHSEHLAGRTEHRRVHGTSRRFGAGSARTTALKYARGDIVAFLDDDAEASADWLEVLVTPYTKSDVIAVGGSAIPRYETTRPRWFPREFDWVFGCTYAGMPTKVAPIRHLIGANMSARREGLVEVGGFHSVDFDDMDICHRLANAFPKSYIAYNPGAVVHHFVSKERVTWRYFWRRCFHVNKQKVRAFLEMGEAANLASERDFVTKILTRQVVSHLRELFAGDYYAAVRLGVSLTGVALAGLGNLAGRIEARRLSTELEPG